MSELRKDIISGHWVILASERGKRPDDFRPARLEQKEEVPAFCPFCEGNESKTPPEVASLRKRGSGPDQPGWRVRTVPNKFPALNRGLPPERHDEGIFQWMDGVGVHEVIIETPTHLQELPDLPVLHLQDVLATYQEGVKSIEEEYQYKDVQVFENKGRAAARAL